MGTDPTVVSTTDNSVCTVVLNRPEKRNAMNALMAAELLRAIEDARANARALIIAGGPPAFSAGADMTEGHGDWFPTIEALAALPIPTVAAIEGFCLGGGLLIATSCDLRVAGASSMFGAPEIRRGLIYNIGGAWSLPRMIGIPRAKQLMMTGESIDARTAKTWGLVNTVTPDGEALKEATRVAHRLAEGPPIALRWTKALVASSLERSYLEAIAAEKLAEAEVNPSADAAEGQAAFFEHRPPRFEGR